ncbi:MAG: hypothetical protein JO013_15805 [Alphaproteobacteria bacterium]|nr:hypothetical protein [Alphaproteobacteria bacterium]
MLRRLLSALLLLAASATAAFAAPPVVVSPRAEAVAVTVYRAPLRSDADLDLDWLRGYALITETRTVRLPAGTSVVRFEGVSDGIIPASAIAQGLPGPPGEKNRDARLISAASLVEAALGRRVHVRRTDRKTGRITESEAILLSGPDGIVLQTREGFEALRCAGLPETLVYDSLPAGLTDKPTLAVTTTSPEVTVATVRLSYLATGFDWRANYVAEVAPDGRTLDLFAWLTLANGNGESFADARTMAVAGKPNAEDKQEEQPDAGEIQLRCWPQGRTHEIPLTGLPAVGDTLNSLPQTYASDAIVVTGTRIPKPNLESPIPITTVVATQEELGDLKLYRIPIPVTVAARGQKQVALLARKAVTFERRYSFWLRTDDRDPDPEPVPVSMLLRMENRKEKGLGLPLPQGKAAVFQSAHGQPLLVGETAIEDSAVGQQVELSVGQSNDVRIAHRIVRKGDEGDDDDGAGEAVERKHRRARYDPTYNPRPELHEVELSNAGPVEALVEVIIAVNQPWEAVRPSVRLGVKDGRKLWLARVPAQGRARLSFTLRPVPKLLPRRPDDERDEGD